MVVFIPAAEEWIEWVGVKLLDGIRVIESRSNWLASFKLRAVVSLRLLPPRVVVVTGATVWLRGVDAVAMRDAENAACSMRVTAVVALVSRSRSADELRLRISWHVSIPLHAEMGWREKEVYHANTINWVPWAHVLSG